MKILCQIFLVSVLALVLFIIFRYEKNKNIAIAKIKNIIMPNNKNRNFAIKNMQNATQNHQFSKNFSVCYKKLKIKKGSKQFYKLSKNFSKPLYFENKERIKNLLSISKAVEQKILLSNEKYRGVYGKAVVDVIAEVYANEILAQDDFNVYSKFSELVSRFKIYKKEAQILNTLLTYKLLEIYLKIYKDISAIKRDINLGSKLKFLPKRLSYASIYGAVKFSPKSTKHLLNLGNRAIGAVNNLLGELDDINNRLDIIYRYIIMLYKGI